MANGQDFNVFGGSQNVAAQAQKQFISNLFRQPPSSGVGSFSAIERRLSMYASSEDTRVIAGVEKVLEKIDGAVKVGVFGSEPAVLNYIESYKDAMEYAVTFKDVILDERKKFYTSTNPSSIKKVMQEARNTFIGGKAGKSIEHIENHIVDLSISRNKLSDIQQLPKSLDDRFTSSMTMLNNALKEFGTDGLNEKELNRIMNSTYAIIKQSEAQTDAAIIHAGIMDEYNMPQYQEKGYIKVLEDALTNINAYDDNLDLLYAENFFFEHSQVATSGDVPLTAVAQKVILLEQHRERLKARYALPYKNAYNGYEELRKKHPDRMVLLDWNKIKNNKIHNELMNYVPPNSNNNSNNNKNNNNTGSNIYTPTSPTDDAQSRKIIGNMLTRRTINFTKDIYDLNKKVWQSEGESIKGLGITGKDAWQIKEIVRDKADNLEKITLIFPQDLVGYQRLSVFPLPDKRYPNEITLTPDNFVVEDDKNYSGPGYKSDEKFGKTSYNIFNNKYELIK